MCNPAQELSNAIDTIGNAGQDIIDAGKNTVDRFLDDPLPVIETAALMWVLGPEALAVDLSPEAIAAVSSAAVSAANGGSVEDIALNAGAAYLGSQVGQAVGETVSPIEGKTLTQLGPQYADTALLKQVVTSSSAAAATTALRGGDLNAILTSGISGGVSSAVADSLKAQGYTNVDQKLVANATAAATRAILNGTSVSSAIGSSVAATALAATISGKVGQINKNNEIGTSALNKISELRDAAQKYYDDNKIADLESSAKTNYQLAVDAKSSYDTMKSTFDTTYADYTKNKDIFENYDKKMVADGYSLSTDEDGRNIYSKKIGGHLETMTDGEGNSYQRYVADVPAEYDSEGNLVKQSSLQTIYAPDKDTFKTTANKDAKALNDLAPKIKEAATSATDYSAAFKTSQEALKPLVDYYTSNFITPATDLQKQITTAAAANQDLATQLGKDVTDYKGLITQDATGVSNILYDQKVVDQAVNAYKIADAQIATSGTQYAQADTGTATDAGGANTRTVQAIFRRDEDGNLTEFIPDGKGGYQPTGLTYIWGSRASGADSAGPENLVGTPTGNVYVVDPEGKSSLSPLSESQADVSTMRTLKDGSTVEYRPDGTTIRTNPDGSTETMSADGIVTDITPATKPVDPNAGGSSLYAALELAFQNSLKSGVKTGAVRNDDGSITVGDTTVKRDGTVTGSGAGNATVNSDGSVTLGPVTIGGGGTGSATGGGSGGGAGGATTGGGASGATGGTGGGGITTTASQDPAVAARLAAEKAAAEKLKAEQDAAAAKLETQRQGNIKTSQLGIMALIPQLQGALSKAQEIPAQAQQQPEVVKTTTPFNLESPLDVGYFGAQQQTQRPEKDTQNQDGTVKIASGGFMDDLLELLNKRG